MVTSTSLGPPEISLRLGCIDGVEIPGRGVADGNLRGGIFEHGLFPEVVSHREKFCFHEEIFCVSKHFCHVIDLQWKYKNDLCLRNPALEV